MHDDRSRLDWYNCKECDGFYTWFRVEIIEGLEMYGWLHKQMYPGCSRMKELNWSDTRGEAGDDKV
jgi:hypothetical protein